MERQVYSGSDKLTATFKTLSARLTDNVCAQASDRNPDLSTLPEAQRDTYMMKLDLI
jgi:hypothetical protein